VLELKVHDGDREVVLQFEHSLLSLSKWESKTRQAFLTTRQKTPDEMIGYFQDMLLPPANNPNLVYGLSPTQIEELTNYINNSHTASSVPDEVASRYNPETITSELIYYWLVAMQIPFHPAETWHLSRLMMLVQITNFKNQPPKKRKASEVYSEWRRENERRKKMFNTNG
jgi:hypothetical protein